MESWRKNKLAFAVLALPPTAWLVVFFTVPLIIMLVYSFAERGPQGQIILAVNFANYARAIEWIHLGIIWKSIWIAAITTVITFAVGFPLAMGIAFAPARWKNLLLLLVILPFWTNLLIRTYAWIAVLRTRGFLNFGLERLHEELSMLFVLIGLPDMMGEFQALELLYNQKAVVIGLVYVYLPFLALPIYATLEKLDKSYLEASLDLGANQWQTFWNVTFPYMKPGLVAGALLAFTLSLDDFVITFFTSGPGSTTFPIKIYSMVRFSVTPEVNAASTVLIVLTLALTLVALIVQSRSQGK